MEGSIVVGKVASENSDKPIVIKLDAIQCSVENYRGKDVLSATKVRSNIKVKEGGKPPVIEGIGSNKLGKDGNRWVRSVIVVNKEGNKRRKELGEVTSDYYSKALNQKLTKAREKAGLNGKQNEK